MTEDHPLARYLVPLRRRWPIILVTLAVALIGVWVTLPEAPDPDAFEEIDPEVSYSATHLLLRERTTADTANFDLLVLLARQGDLHDIVEEELGDAVEPGSVDAVGLEPNSDLGTLGISAIQPTPERATLLVDTYAEELVRYFDERAEVSGGERIEQLEVRVASLEEQVRALEVELGGVPEASAEARLIQSELDALVQQFGALQSELQSLRSQAAEQQPTFRTIQEPSPSPVAGPGAPRFEVPATPWARFGLGIGAALLLGIGLVFALDWMDTRIRTRNDAQEAFGLPVLAEVERRTKRAQRADPLPTVSDPSSSLAEAFRSLRLSLTLAPKWELDHNAPVGSGAVGSAVPSGEQQQPRTILVTSARDGEGKSTVVANLAISFAETGQSVLVVDCDFRRSTVSGLLDAPDGPGLRTLGEGQYEDLASLAEASEHDDDIASLVLATDHDNVAVIRTGAAGIAPAWFPARSAEIVARAAELADVVIFDTGPLLATNEAAAMIPTVDTVLATTMAGRISRTQGTRATELLTQLRATVAGVVLMGSESAGRDGYYYYAPIRDAKVEGERSEPWIASRMKRS